jgi:hypothetical protein
MGISFALDVRRLKPLMNMPNHLTPVMDYKPTVEPAVPFLRRKRSKDVNLLVLLLLDRVRFVLDARQRSLFLSLVRGQAVLMANFHTVSHVGLQ